MHTSVSLQSLVFTVPVEDQRYVLRSAEGHTNTYYLCQGPPLAIYLEHPGIAISLVIDSPVKHCAFMFAGIGTVRLAFTGV